MRKLTIIAIAGFVWVNFISQVSAAPNSAGTNVYINDTVYMITADNYRRPYTSEAVFLSYHFNNFSSVSMANADDIALPIGSPVPPRDGSIACHYLIDHENCFLISQGRKIKLSLIGDVQFDLRSDRVIIADIGFVPEATAEDLAKFNSTLLSSSNGDGSVASAKSDYPNPIGAVIAIDNTAYLVGANGLMGIPSIEVLNSWGYNADDIVEANSEDRKKPIRFVLESRFGSELRPFEPVIPAPLQLTEQQKFYFPLAQGTPYEITESWLYSREERAIHGYVNHGAIDYAVPKGTPIYAVADGYAIASTHLAPLNRTWNNLTPVGFGLGEFVQVWHPEQQVYTSYSHLSKQAEGIPYFEPVCENGACDPKIIYNPTEYIESVGVFVKRGHLLGYAGDSGLSLGYHEHPRQENVLPSWDEVHLHFEVYTRHPQTFGKFRRYDPYGIYGRVDQYPGDLQNSNVLWRIDIFGNLVHSK